jgi:hypothetical protein
MAITALALGPAASASALPEETSWTATGLREMVRVSGPISWSIDGLGVSAGAGTVQVEKPVGGTVLNAYFIAAQTNIGIGSPSGIRLNGSDVTFTHLVESSAYTEFRNTFTDATELVQETIDAAPSGIVDIEVDEGETFTEGTTLIVIFQDPAVDTASVMLYFGASDSAGDSFTLDFPVLTAPQLEDLRMSVGSSFSYGEGQNSSAWVNGELLTEQLGHFDDCDQFDPDSDSWTCDNGALLTVGGVGDSLDNPTVPSQPWSQVSDDELYSLSPFVAVGDTTIEVETQNASGDDNIFFSGFYLNHVTLDGSDPIGEPVDEEPITEEPAEDAILPATGPDVPPVAATVLALLLAGGVLLAFARRVSA